MGEKQLSVFCSRGGQNSLLMHVPLYVISPKIINLLLLRYSVLFTVKSFALSPFYISIYMV